MRQKNYFLFVNLGVRVGGLKLIAGS
ncbi:MAG: hypothetical protein RLZZ566_2194, partial [Pseudomonadota bacterium]